MKKFIEASIAVFVGVAMTTSVAVAFLGPNAGNNPAAVIGTIAINKVSSQVTSVRGTLLFQEGQSAAVQVSVRNPGSTAISNVKYKIYYLSTSTLTSILKTASIPDDPAIQTLVINSSTLFCSGTLSSAAPGGKFTPSSPCTGTLVGFGMMEFFAVLDDYPNGIQTSKMLVYSKDANITGARISGSVATAAPTSTMVPNKVYTASTVVQNSGNEALQNGMVTVYTMECNITTPVNCSAWAKAKEVPVSVAVGTIQSPAKSSAVSFPIKVSAYGKSVRAHIVISGDNILDVGVSKPMVADPVGGFSTVPSFGFHTASLGYACFPNTSGCNR